MGDYLLIAKIGEGGMGVVHLAAAADGRRVALKVLRPHIVGDQEARERLAREVGSLSRIVSPRVAEVLDADPYGEVPFVATRYVPGLSLHQHLREHGPIEDTDLAWFAEGLAEALIAVHKVGVLHRDIKPSNVLLEGRSPVLIDFGLARLAEDPRLTQTGWLLGTPGYLAPEIMYGDEATPASDVHAWAATVVFAATGHPPYGKGPAIAVMDRVRRGEHDLVGVPEELAPLLRSALAPDPLDRPLIAEIHTWLRQRRTDPGAAVQPGSAHPAADWTMPIAAAYREPATEVRPATTDPKPPTTASAPASAPYVEPPAPQTRVLPATVPPPDATPRVSQVSSEQDGPEQDSFWPFAEQPADPGDNQVPRSRLQRFAVLVGLGALAAGFVAAIPFVAACVLGVVALLLRTGSVTAQRHRRRRSVRGRARWYDLPASTLLTPGYLALAALGTVGLVLWAAAVAVAVGLVVAVLSVPLVSAMFVVGIAFVLALWWGPGSGRVRRATRTLAGPITKGGWVGWVLAVAALVLAAALVASIGPSGPDWSPRGTAPWDHGLLARFAAHL